MILLAIIAMMYVNREVKLPATSLFALSMIFMILLTVAGTFDVWTDVSVLSPEEAARVVMLRRIGSAFGYALRPLRYSCTDPDSSPKLEVPVL